MRSQGPTNLTDHYQLLGVSFNASEDEIRRAYRRMAMQWHPDRNDDPAAEEMMKKINGAWEILGDPESKAEYDRDYFRLRSILAEARRREVEEERLEKERREEERRRREAQQREAERLGLVTQLLTAIRVNRSLQEISTLIDKGADINARTNGGRTLLHHAASNNGNPAVITLLISRGAYINARTNHDATPLHYAARYNENPEVIQMLISRGAGVNARDNNDLMPLHVAARYNENPAVIDVLVSRGAYLSEPDINGLTPLDYAARYNENPEVFRLLRSRSASATRSATATSSSGHPCALSMLWSFFRQ